MIRFSIARSIFFFLAFLLVIQDAMAQSATVSPRRPYDRFALPGDDDRDFNCNNEVDVKVVRPVGRILRGLERAKIKYCIPARYAWAANIISYFQISTQSGNRVVSTPDKYTLPPLSAGSTNAPLKGTIAIQVPYQFYESEAKFELVLVAFNPATFEQSRLYTDESYHSTSPYRFRALDAVRWNGSSPVLQNYADPNSVVTGVTTRSVGTFAGYGFYVPVVYNGQNYWRVYFESGNVDNGIRVGWVRESGLSINGILNFGKFGKPQLSTTSSGSVVININNPGDYSVRDQAYLSCSIDDRNSSVTPGTARVQLPIMKAHKQVDVTLQFPAMPRASSYGVSCYLERYQPHYGPGISISYGWYSGVSEYIDVR